MKKNTKIIIIVALILVVGIAAYFMTKNVENKAIDGGSGENCNLSPKEKWLYDIVNNPTHKSVSGHLSYYEKNKATKGWADVIEFGEWAWKGHEASKSSIYNTFIKKAAWCPSEVACFHNDSDVASC